MSQADLTVDELSRILYQTDRDALKRFLRGVLDVRWSGQDPVPLDAQLRVLLEDWMAHLSFLTDAQRFEINRRVRGPVEAHAAVLAKQETPTPVFRLVIGDYRWVSCDGRDGFFDLQELDEVPETPFEAVTYVVCDLTALYLRSRSRLTRVRRMLNAGKDAHVPADPEDGLGNSYDRR